MFSDPGWQYISPPYKHPSHHHPAQLRWCSLSLRPAEGDRPVLWRTAARSSAYVLTDGRDVPDNSCHEYMATFADSALEGRDQVASGGGRMKVTMDRYEADWPMVERGWKAHVLGEALISSPIPSRRSRSSRAATVISTLSPLDC